MKKILVLALAIAAMLGVVGGCNPFRTDADVVSDNISKSADQFSIPRRVVFYNGITDTYMLTIEGYCSLGNFDPQKQLTVTCKVGDSQYKKHFLGLSDNVTYFVEQLDPASVSKDHYLVVFKPSVIVPDIKVP